MKKDMGGAAVVLGLALLVMRAQASRALAGANPGGGEYHRRQRLQAR